MRMGRRGVRTLLVEKDPDTKQWPKMDRSNARTMEFYRRLGFADRVRELGYPPEASMDVFIVTRLADPPQERLVNRALTLLSFSDELRTTANYGGFRRRGTR